MPGKKILIALVAGALLAGGAVALDLGVGAATSRPRPHQTVIDARKDPAAANTALNQFCNPGPNGVDPKCKSSATAITPATFRRWDWATQGDRRRRLQLRRRPSADTQAGYTDDSVEVTDSRSSYLTTRRA